MKTTTKLLLAAGAWAGYAFVQRQRLAYRFSGKVVVLTGGSRGLGLAMARRLADEGALLALVARDKDELERAVGELEERGATVRAYVGDVKDKASVERAIAAISDDFGRIEVLINNAGTILTAPFENQTDEDFENAWQTHLKGALYTTRAVLPLMRRQGGGRILNISSVSGKMGIPHMSAYSTSKHALVGFSHSLAAELRSLGIRVTVACPGLMRTGSHRATEFRGRHEEEFGWFTTLNATPVLGSAADASAKKILDACRMGRVEIMFPWHWRLAALGSGLFPGLSVQANVGVDRLFPEADEEVGNESLTGLEARGDKPSEAYMRNVEQAAADLNQS